MKRHLFGLRTLIRFTIWLWEPMVFTDPVANRVRPRLLTHASATDQRQRIPRSPSRPAVSRPLPYRALVLTD